MSSLGSINSIKSPTIPVVASEKNKQKNNAQSPSTKGNYLQCTCTSFNGQ